MAQPLLKVIAQAPPGQVDDVEKDVRSLMDRVAEDELVAELAKYHTQQFTAVVIPGLDRRVVLSPHNRVEGNKFVEHLSGKQFVVDFRTLDVTDVEDVGADDLLRDLYTKLAGYVAEHFPSNAGAGITRGENGTVTMVVAGSRISRPNFWSGRWRGEYVYDKQAGTVDGFVRVDVHYYEDGNVRLLTSHKEQQQVSGTASPEDLVSAIKRIETGFETELNQAFSSLAETAYKRLRRQLPITRQRINWDQISSLRVGQDVVGNRKQ